MIELVLIFLLLIANGVFAMTEIAIVSAKPSRLRERAAAGDRGAQVALDLVKTPDRFLSTVQIGITLVGIVAGAFGGDALAKILTPSLTPLFGEYAPRVSFGIVIVILTYFSVIIGELIPKHLALLMPETLACKLSGPMAWLSRIAAPVVSLLAFSTNSFLRIFGIRKNEQDALLSRTDLTVLVREGVVSGSLRTSEGEMVETVLGFASKTAIDIMTPKPKLVFLEESEQQEEIWRKVGASPLQHFPVYSENRDNIVGLVSLTALYANVSAGSNSKVGELAVSAIYVPENQPAFRTLETMTKAKASAVLVTDEFGGVRGMISARDFLEDIVGEFVESENQSNPAVRQDGDSWISDGLTEFEELTAVIPDFPEPDSAEYVTAAGFILSQMQRIPAEGEKVQWQGFEFEVLDMDRQRIDKLRIRKVN